MFTLYVHIAPNGKRYFGITSKSINERSQNGKGYQRCKLFWKAIQKYGWESFQHIVISENLSKEQACELERYYINEYKSNNPEFGYNIALGGDGAFGVHPSEETKEKLRKANLGKHHTEETKEKIRKNHAHFNRGRKFHFTEEQKNKLYATRRGRTPWNKGLKMSEEQRKKLSDAHKGKAPWNKGVPCTEEVKLKVSMANKGKVSHNKNKPQSDTVKQKISKSLKNRVWVNNGIHRTLIRVEELDKYLNDGYVRGRGHKTD